ncbi:hypothetical protein [Gaoshiqia sp. Z1-71]|uniref:hypothetical protein n=1 Tax=Gaoshiqia hydrogeniformans TaxID=3290090 RepID=UPI003BF8D9B1
MNQVFHSPTPLIDQQNICTSVFVADQPEESSFWGLFEGKSKSGGTTSTGDRSANTGGTSGGSGFFKVVGSIFTGIAGVASTVAPVLPSLGVGSNSRIKEIEATANANTQVYNAQIAATLAQSEAESKKQTETMLIIGGALLILLLVFIVASKR